MNFKNNFRNLMALAVLSFCFSSCQDQFEDVQPNALKAVAEQHASDKGMTVTEIPFTATAVIAACHGENIRFSGTIENREKKLVSASGVTHYTRQFTVKGMTGVGVTIGGVTTGTVYDVIGGAEMFSIKDPVYSANGSLNLGASINESDVVIHRGTLVFVSRTDGSRVVARHIITRNPAKGTMVNTWDCGEN